MNKDCKNFIESLIFSAEKPLNKESMKKCFFIMVNFKFRSHFKELKHDFKDRGVELVEFGKKIFLKQLIH
ncbi:MAG: hypothetical protein CM15mP40_11780 [Alphaproteobacteria bacterium]|nr:MAG: hypothetical protein CM15mP40_11780 [Alphaproteobacteria bacterium]